MVKGSPDEGLEALVLSVNKNMETLEDELSDTKTALEEVLTRVERLPEKFIPRPEAKEKADVISQWLRALLFAGVVVAVCGIIGWSVNYARANQSLENCEKTREGIQLMVEKAVSNPTLREELLSIEGTKPELCR